MATQTVIQISKQAAEIAETLVHRHHGDLQDARILWLLSSAKRTREGRVRLGVGKKASPELRFLSSAIDAESREEMNVEEGYDFIVTLSQSHWRSADQEMRYEMVDHQLCHLERRERIHRRTGKVTVSWARRGHDLEEFIEIVQRYGLQNPRTRTFAAASRQLVLDLKPEESADAPALERETLVAPDGLVYESKMLPGVDEAEEDVTEESGDIAEEGLPERANGHSWQDQAGIGSSEPEKRRRTRKAKS